MHLPQASLNAETLSTLLRSLTRARLIAMAEAARAIGKPHATESVANEIESVARAEEVR